MVAARRGKQRNLIKARFRRAAPKSSVLGVGTHEHPGIQVLYAYNRWANRRLLQTARLLDWQDCTKDMGTSHGSVRGSLFHILWSEWLRWRGESPKEMFASEDFPDWTTLELRWGSVEIEQQGFFSRLTDDLLETRVSYENLQGERWEYSLAQMIQHVVNHSSYHRGQVVALLRQLGQTPPATDFLVFLDKQFSADRGVS